jgi:hypothetical protein
MLHGFSVPLTPQGKSALVSPPPWHYSSDCLVVEYWTDPAAIAALLPPGVTPDETSPGRAFLWFLDWQFTGSNDAAIARGWAQGFPKKLGSIYQTRSFSAPSAAAAPLAKGSRFGASVAAHGERLATARVQLEEKAADPAKVFKRPTVMRRYFPQLAAARRTKPPVDELTMSLTDNLAIVDVWAGSAELTIPEVRGEDMHSLAPLRIGRGYRLGMSYSVTDLRILKNYLG